MKTFEVFVNKSKYEMLVVYIETMKEGYLFQNLCFEHEIYWAGIESAKKKSRMLGDGGDNYLYILIKNPTMHRSDEYREDFVRRYEHPDKIFTIKDFNDVKSILSNGVPIPSYAPRRIDRTLERLNESQYFTSNNDLPLDDMPKYKIGDVVKFRENAEGIQLTASSNYWGFINNQ